MSTNGKRAMHQYSEESLKSALIEIREGTSSISGASKKYGVPRSTIQDRIHGRVADEARKMGPHTILLEAEEQRLVKWCEDLARCGFPLKVEDLLNTVQAIIKEDQRPTPFLNGRPGRKWYLGFLKRNPSISLREAEGITKGRAVITKEYIQKWFEDLKNFLNEQHVLDILDDPQRIFNGDETSFSLCPKTGKVLASKGYKNVYNIQKGNEKETITVLLVFSACGQTIVPMVVFPYVRPPKDVINSVPENWFLGKSETGWMVSETFFEYIANGVHSWLNHHNVKRPILLFVDGHKSHMTLELSKFCEDNGIILYAHIMQPADVSVFKPLKSEWKKTVREWQLKPENYNKVISKLTFCPLLSTVLSSLSLEDTIKNGFRKCGLFPFNPENVDYTKCVQNHSDLLAKEQHETDSTHKATDLDVAIDVINKIALKLRERGIDSDVIVEEIRLIKDKENDQTVEILGDVTIQSGTYIINEEGILQLQTSNIQEPTTSPEPPRSLSPTNARNNSFLPINSSSPIPAALPNNVKMFESTIDCLSPTSSIKSLQNNILNSLSNSPNSGTTLTGTQTISMSPSFEKHLYFPKLSKQARKRKKGKKQLCSTCKEDLDSDAEDDALKNIGCDSCPKWFHMKCTCFKEMKYEDVVLMDFVCEACKTKQTENI